MVLATGGLSLPKTGSDGWGLAAARRLGHSIVPTTPALAPITLQGGFGRDPFRVVGRLAAGTPRFSTSPGLSTTKVAGSLLWTHFGLSGPAALDMSRHWLRAELEQRPATMTASFSPGAAFEALDAQWTARARSRPKSTTGNTLAGFVPASVALAILGAMGLDCRPHDGDLHARRAATSIHAITAWPLGVTGSRGYSYAEVTAGGVSLPEIQPGSMESRIVSGLYLVGEILDVDGRLGGFNFQWAWASAKVAADAIAARSLG